MHGTLNTLTGHEKAPISLDALAPLRQWVAWRLDQDKPGKDGKPGKLSKVPYRPDGRGKASSTNPGTWGTRAEAEARAKAMGVEGTKGGIGIVLGNLVDGRGMTLVGIDLDSCIDANPDFGVSPSAEDVIARLPTYTEVSPSGTGVKLFGVVPTSSLPRLLAALGKGPKGKQLYSRKWTHGTGEHPPGVELYLGQRYFAVTGEWDLDWRIDLHLLDVDALLKLIRSENARSAAPKDAATPAKTGDQSRSDDAARMVVRLKGEGKSFEDFKDELASDPELAEWAEDTRQVERTWNNIGTTRLTEDEVDDSFKDQDAPTKGVAGLQTTKSGGPRSNLLNALRLMRSDPALSGLLAFDEMQCTAMLMHAVPRHGASSKPAASTPRPVEDGDVTALLEYLQAARLTALTANVLHLAVERRARECAFHPVRDYLYGLVWDGEPRLDVWLTAYLGAEATPYAGPIGRMFLIAMVARVFKPGCKVDYVPILEGVQGAGKSAACRILGDPWFSDGLPELGSDAVRVSQHLRGKWLIELAELSAMGRAEATTLKAFITREVEGFTPKYGRRDVHEPRKCVFIGTTNPDGNGYLKDSTGGRRFWPVKVGDAIDLDGLARARDQLFAEAVFAYRAGEQWWPTQDFERQHIAPEQDARRESDGWQDPINTFLKQQAGLPVSIAEVAKDALTITMERLTLPIQHRIGRCLRAAGWVQRRSKAERWWEPEAGDAAKP